MSPGSIRVDAETGECLVFTRKEGLLSRVAHDLKLRVTDFQIERIGRISGLRGPRITRYDNSRGNPRLVGP